MVRYKHTSNARLERKELKMLTLAIISLLSSVASYAILGYLSREEYE